VICLISLILLMVEVVVVDNNNKVLRNIRVLRRN